jgi:hypothetical protein
LVAVDRGAPDDGEGVSEADVAGSKREPSLVGRILGRLDAFSVLRERDEDQALAQLEALGVDGAVESEMLAELSARMVLADPERFVEAHAAVMKGLEVLARHRARAPALRVGGPVRPVAGVLVGQFSRMQLDGYERKVLRRLGSLYRRREAQTVAGSADQLLLRRARKQVDRLRSEVTGGGVAFTKLLLGGAVFSVASTGLSSLLDTINAHWWVFAIVAALFVLLALGTFWVILQSAAIARKRIRITLDEPLQSLYDTVGGAGEPPDDPTRQFALFSLIALVVGWIVIPVAVGLLLWPD